MAAPPDLQKFAIGPNQAFSTDPSNRTLQRFDTIEAAKGNEAFQLGQTQGPVLLPIYKPGMPIRMVSALNSTALKPGEFSLLQNVRPDNDVISARYPTTLFGGVTTTFSPAASSTFAARGIWSGNLNGTQYVVGAWYDGTAVRLYSSTDGHSYTEVTSTASAYGLSGAGTSTRFTDSGANCAFQSYTNTSPAGVSTDYLVVQNGTSVPMIYSTTAVHSAHVFPIQNITAPTAYETIQPSTYAQQNNAWPFGSTSFSGTNSVAGMSFPAGPTASLFVPLTINQASHSSPLTATSQCSISQGSVINVSPTQQQNSQFCLVWDYPTGFDYLLSGFQLDAYDTIMSQWVPIYNPAGTAGSPPIEISLDGPIVTNPASLFIYAMPAGTYAFDGIRLTGSSNIAAPPGSGTTVMNLYAVFVSGSFPYGSQIAVSYANSATLTESAGVVLEAVTNTPSYAGVGMSPGYVGTLPVNSTLNAWFGIPALSSSQYASGVDTLNIYVSLPGSTTFGYSQSATIATYSGSWSASSAAPIYPYKTPVDTYQSPDAYSTQIPIGSCMAAGGGRSFVGAGSQYWFSEYGLPFRYRLVLDVEQNVARSGSGGYGPLPNTEKCVAFATAGAAALGSSNMFLFSNASIYNITGPDGQSLSSPTLLASVGCSSPDSVAIYQDSIFFQDDNYQIRKFGYGKSQFYLYANVNSYELMPMISRRVIDDYLKAIPNSRIGNSVGCAGFDRYYFGFTPTGSTNSKGFVWDETIGSFVLDSFPGTATAESICSTIVGGTKAIIVQSSDKQVYVWENSSSSSTVNASLTTGSLNPNGSEKTFFGRVKMIADVQSGQSMPIVKNLLAGGSPTGSAATDSSSIDMSTGITGNYVYRYDSKVLTDGTMGPAGQQAVTCQFAFGSIPMVPGTNIYSIEVETMPATPGADSL